MKKILTIFCLLITGLLLAQKSNIFLDRDFWSPQTTLIEVKQQIEKGNDPTQLDPHGFDAPAYAILGETPNDVIEYLINIEGNDVNKITHDLRTYIFWAAYKGNLPLIKFLLGKGAKTDLLDNKGNTVLLFTALGGQFNRELYDILLKNGSPISDVNYNGTNALLLAIGYAKDLEDISYFLEKGLPLSSTDKMGYNAIDYAARLGNKKVIEQLIEKGIPYKDTNKDGSNVVLIAAKGYWRNVNNLEFFQFLDSLGIEANVQDENHNTPLHYLAYKVKNNNLFDFFINKGVNVNQANKEGNLPVMNAVYSNTPEVVSYLIENGAHTQIKDTKGNNLAYFLIQSFKPNKKEEFEKKWELLTQQNTDFSAVQENGQNIYHLAVEKNSPYLFKKIAEDTSININQKDSEGLTPLQRLAMSTNNPDDLQLLLELGADPTILSDFGESAYDLAKENELLKDKDVEFLVIEK